MRTDLPGVGTVWRDRYSPKRTVKVIGDLGASGPVVSNVLTDDTGAAASATVHTKLSEWDWLYEPAALGPRQSWRPGPAQIDRPQDEVATS